VTYIVQFQNGGCVMSGKEWEGKCVMSGKVKAKREKYDGCYELNIQLAYIHHTGKKRDQKASLSN
jgi:hypothetical protein